MSTRSINRMEIGTYAFWVALACLILLSSSCHTRYQPTARPKYGDVSKPIGPDKSLFTPPAKAKAQPQ
jgi:hypothetical protein